jgi:small nuclear ribonucleoprotein (snRNP)-like protein
MTLGKTTTRAQQNNCKLAILFIGVVLILALGAGCNPAGNATGTAVAFTTPYQAVLLSNNSVYFGKLSGFGTPNPVLTDVFYIVTQTDPATKESKNILVKRGKELHGPDRMYLNASSIVFVEPVGADSKVAQLIDEAGKK